MKNRIVKKIEDILFTVVLGVLVLSLIMAALDWLGGYVTCSIPCRECHQYKTYREMENTYRDEALCKECAKKGARQ